MFESLAPAIEILTQHTANHSLDHTELHPSSPGNQTSAGQTDVALLSMQRVVVHGRSNFVE